MVHNGAADVTEDEPYHREKHILDCWGHADIMPQVGSKMTDIQMKAANQSLNFNTS
jgi:hypothetical protein